MVVLVIFVPLVIFTISTAWMLYDIFATPSKKPQLNTPIEKLKESYASGNIDLETLEARIHFALNSGGGDNTNSTITYPGNSYCYEYERQGPQLVRITTNDYQAFSASAVVYKDPKEKTREEVLHHNP